MLEGDEEKPEDTETKSESPEPPVETSPSGSGEDSPSADNGENIPPSGTQEDGSPANPPAGDGQAAAQPPAKAPAATEPDAEAGTGTDGLCTHHPEHTAGCGYAAADETNEEKPCTYDCKFCPIEEKISALPESVTAANKETVQTQVDEIAALLAALAEGESANVFNLSAYEQIKQQLETPEPYAGTAAAKVEKGDTTTYADTLEDALAADNSGATVTLLKDVVLSKPITISESVFFLDLGGYSITGSDDFPADYYFSVRSAMMIQGSGTITTTKSGIFQVGSGGMLRLEGGTFQGETNSAIINVVEGGHVDIDGDGVTINCSSGKAVNIDTGGLVMMKEGTIQGDVYIKGVINLFAGTFSSIRIDENSDRTLKDSLGLVFSDGIPQKCLAYYLNGVLIKDPDILAGKELDGNITVKECTHEFHGTPNDDGTTHKQTCLACNIPETTENCTFQQTPDKENTATEHFGSCPVCKRVRDGAHDFEDNGSGEKTCKICNYKIVAAAKVEKDGTTTYADTLADAFTAENDGATVTLLRDVVLESMITVSKNCNFTLDLNGYDITTNAKRDYYFNIPENSSLIVQGNGSITTSTTRSGGFLVSTGGTAEINDGVNIDCGSDEAVRVDGTVVINGGDFQGKIVNRIGDLTINGGTFSRIEVNTTTGKTLKGVLGNKDNAPCAYYLEGELLTDIENRQTEIIANQVVAGYALSGNITVRECTHSYQTTSNADGATHTKTCLACGDTQTENCTFQQNPEKPNTATEHFGTCPDCGQERNGAHTGEWSADGKRTCTVCGLQQEAIAKYKLFGDKEIFIADLEEMFLYNWGGTVTLLKNVELTAPVVCQETSAITLDLAGYTIQAGDFRAFQLGSGSNLMIQDGTGTGEIINNSPDHDTIYCEDGNLTIWSGKITNNSGFALNMKKSSGRPGGADVRIEGGTFSGGIKWDLPENYYLYSFLASKLALYNENDEIITEHIRDAAGTLTGVITVKPCTHKGLLTDNGNGTHSGKCASCGQTLTSQPHVWNTDTEGGIACELCNVKAIAKTEKDGQTEYITKLKETYGEDYQGTTLTLLQDIDLGEKTVFISAKEFTLDLNGHTLRSNVGNGTVNIKQEGHLTLVNKEPFGEIASNRYAVKVYGTLNMESGRVAGSTAIQAKEGCTINIHGGEIVAVDEYSDGLQILGDYNSPISANIKIFGGSFYGKRCIKIGTKSGHTLTSILPESYAYYQNGKPIPIPEADEDYQILDASEGPITVGECDHSIAEYVSQNNGTHKLTCPACGLVEDQAACTYGEPEAVDENNHSSVCKFCGYIRKVEHGWEETTRTLNNGLTTEYFNKCSQCGYEQEPFGTVTTSEKSVILTYGETARLSAEAAFNKTVSYQWELGEGTLPGQTGSVYTTPADLAAREHLYTVSIVPEGGKVYSFEFTVLVLPKVIGEAVIELNRNAFRYDGKEHSPEITSVKLGETLLVEGVDYTANIPTGTEAGSYTVTITGKGNYTGTATATFEINEVKEIPLPDAPSLPHLPEDTKVQLSVEIGLSEVPEDLKSKFDTPAKIENELRLKVTANLSGVKEDQIAVYDVRLQYLEGGVWKDVDPDNFPAGGVTAVLPYPDGTDGTNYTFTVQHMISHGDKAGDVETLSYTAVSGGLQCHFTSLSPVAIGYKAIEKTPTPSTPSSPGTLFTDSGSDDDEEEAANPEYDFWQTVREQINKAKSGDTVKVNARGYDRMPATVMAALKKSNNVTLRIRWSGGAEIVIPSAKALSESLRIYYPLSYLAKYDFGDPVLEPAPEHLNPATGGDIEVEAPVTAEAALDAAGAPVVTDSRRGLAETEEQAEQGIEKAIPGVYQPETPGGEAVSPVEPAVSGQPEADRGGSGILPILLALLAAASCGVLMWWNRRNRQNSK